MAEPPSRQSPTHQQQHVDPLLQEREEFKAALLAQRFQHLMASRQSGVSPSHLSLHTSPGTSLPREIDRFQGQPAAKHPQWRRTFNLMLLMLLGRSPGLWSGLEGRCSEATDVLRKLSCVSFCRSRTSASTRPWLRPPCSGQARASGIPRRPCPASPAAARRSAPPS